MSRGVPRGDKVFGGVIKLKRKRKVKTEENFMLACFKFQSFHRCSHLIGCCLDADWLTLLRGVGLVPAEEAGRGKLLRGVLGADDDDPLMVGLTYAVALDSWLDNEATLSTLWTRF